MKRLLVFAACVFLCGCVSDPVNSNYHGKDAGVLVVSAGSLDRKDALMFLYRKVGQPSGYNTTGGDGLIHYNPYFIFAHAPDYTGRETGEVFIHYLEPGNYEVYSWARNAQFMGVYLSEQPEKDFSLPFTIEPGKAVYIGNIAVLAAGPPAFRLGTKLYVVSDKHERDLEIARKKEPNLPPVTLAVTDVSTLGEPSLVAREPY